MPPVRLARETTRGDRNAFIGGIGCRDEVISREAERELCLLVTHNPNFGGFPTYEAKHRHVPARLPGSHLRGLRRDDPPLPSRDWQRHAT